MQRSTRKLVILGETIRALTQLELGLASGANPNAQLCSSGRRCRRSLSPRGATTMQRATRKLMIRTETIRALTQLELGRAAGANPNAQLRGTEDAGTGCPLVRALLPPTL